MALVSMKELLQRAHWEQYAVCYCEAWNLESLKAVIEAAKEAESPIIAGFNGEFLAHPGRPKPENLAALVKNFVSEGIRIPRFRTWNERWC